MLGSSRRRAPRKGKNRVNRTRSLRCTCSCSPATSSTRSEKPSISLIGTGADSCALQPKPPPLRRSLLLTRVVCARSDAQELHATMRMMGSTATKEQASRPARPDCERPSRPCCQPNFGPTPALPTRNAPKRTCVLVVPFRHPSCHRGLPMARNPWSRDRDLIPTPRVRVAGEGYDCVRRRRRQRHGGV